MPPESTDDTSTLERIRRRLYANQQGEGLDVPELSHTVPTKTSSWQKPQSTELPKRKTSWTVWFLVFSLIAFLLAAAFAAYFLIFGGRGVSTDKVAIEVNAPLSIASGDTVPIILSITNNNPVPIHSTRITLDFPESARSPETPAAPFSHYEDTVGDIAPGATIEKTVSVILYGAEGAAASVPITFEYRIDGSNATYEKKETYDVTISSSPLSVSAEQITGGNSGELVSFAVTVRSHATVALDGVAIQATYPFGYVPRSGEGTLYQIGRLEPQEERTITVTGTLSGEQSNERVFRFTAGTQTTATATDIAVPYANAEVVLTVAKAFLLPTLAINRDTSNTPVINSGAQVQGMVSWINTLPSSVTNAVVSVQLSGSALDPNSVNAYGGFYRSVDTTVLYSGDTENSLKSLVPGATGSGTFNFSTKTGAAMATLRQPTIEVRISVAGRTAQGNQSVEDVVIRTIKVGTDLTLSTRGLHSGGSIANTGPLPPVANQETTYTIVLSLSNTVNSVGDTVVKATLPSYVRFTGKTSDTSLTHDPDTRTVTWRVGDVPAGTGQSSAEKTVSFQVALLPSVSQRGTSPVLMNAPQVSGIDRFTQKALSVSGAAVTTQISADPGFQAGFGEVQ